MYARANPPARAKHEALSQECHKDQVPCAGSKAKREPSGVHEPTRAKSTAGTMKAALDQCTCGDHCVSVI